MGRIKSISCPPNIENGLGEIRMSRLGKVVLIAGQNGSGKTRFLTNLEQLIASKMDRSSRKLTLRSKRDWETNSQSYKTARDKLITTHSEPRSESVQQRIDELLSDINVSARELSAIDDSIARDSFLEMDEFDTRPTVIHFVPKELRLRDDHTLARGEFVTAPQIDIRQGIGQLSEKAFAYIQQWHNRYFNATHQNSRMQPEEKKKIVERYVELDRLISKFLGQSLTGDVDNNVQLFGRRLGQARLSDGQKVLIQFCVALHLADTNIKDVILFLDEPENHLHPAVLISVLRKISDEIFDGQIWVATHSVHVLSMFDADSIWFMKLGSIFPGGNIQKEVLHGLMGESSDIQRLRDFIDLPDVISRNDYAYQCLKTPMSVVTGVKDPQTKQAHNDLISAARSIGNPLRVLDFGAGKGRMIRAFAAADLESGTNTDEWLDYVAVEPSEQDRTLAGEEICQAYGTNSNRIFSGLSDVVGVYGHGYFDVVLMCNVLHEIDPVEWCALFSSKSPLFNLLKDGGRLLIIEDQLIPIGEMAYKNGFIVLDTPSIRVLFSADGGEYSSTDFRGDGRLKAHSITKACLAKVSAHSRVKALVEHLNLSKANILEMRGRKHEPTYVDGRLHAFWVQQFANTNLALEQLDARQA